MTCWALIPVKPRGLGKTRLDPALGPWEREQLVVAMFHHVLETVHSSPGVDRICVLGAQRPGIGRKATVLPDHGTDLNAALASGLAVCVAAAQPDRILVLPADLPCLTADDVERLARLPDGVMGIAPDRHGTGTNALSLPTQAGAWFPFAFGEGSFARHRKLGLDMGMAVMPVHSPGLSRDIDEPADLPDALHLIGFVHEPRRGIA